MAFVLALPSTQDAKHLQVSLLHFIQLLAQRSITLSEKLSLTLFKIPSLPYICIPLNIYIYLCFLHCIYQYQIKYVFTFWLPSQKYKFQKCRDFFVVVDCCISNTYNKGHDTHMFHIWLLNAVCPYQIKTYILSIN